MDTQWIRRLGRFIRRHSSIVSFILCSLCLIVIIEHQVENKRSRLESFDKVKSLLDRLFDPLNSLADVQTTWNRLFKIWQQILTKFIHDACQFCHENDSDCYESIDIARYVNHINQSFFPFDETKRPNGMGIYYYFDVKTFHSLNNSILSTDVSSCDYFHTIQLLMHVQLILHQAKIKYFLTKGTLIGTLRHHDIIPWDTDVDLFFPTSSIKTLMTVFNQSRKDRRSYADDLTVYPFRNFYNITSYKIFSSRSPIVNGTQYRWPKIDLFPYQENSTHLYAYPKAYHNIGTMNYIKKTNIEPIYLRLLGPLLVPSPYHPRQSLKAMVRLGRSNLFHVCQGNTFLHRSNQQSGELWRIPCKELHRSYLFVQSKRNSSNGLCYEELISSEQKRSLSLYVYQCDEVLERTLTKQ